VITAYCWPGLVPDVIALAMLFAPELLQNCGLHSPAYPVTQPGLLNSSLAGLHESIKQPGCSTPVWVFTGSVAYRATAPGIYMIQRLPTSSIPGLTQYATDSPRRIPGGHAPEPAGACSEGKMHAVSTI
jgi:hypothetical protein